MNKKVPGEITLILTKVGRGDDSAVAALLPVVYDELRALAGSYFKRQTPGHTLEPTALVHDAFIKLAGSASIDWKDRAHFFAIAAMAMRQILADHARSKKAAKRGDGKDRVTLSGLETPHDAESQIDLIALDDALAKLAELAPRQARIVEMRFLAGLNENETAHVLDVTTRTVRREWRLAKAFLECELSGNNLP
ncbi:MAG: sigma-70 family RNA polymerase sigma factor [Planctomycetota bacterium]|jgi:RNA polymerase sigma factor (TIGR02999 family)